MPASKGNEVRDLGREASRRRSRKGGELGQHSECLGSVCLLYLYTYTTAGHLPVDSHVLSASRDEVSIPCRPGGFGVIVGDLGLLAVHMAVL